MKHSVTTYRNAGLEARWGRTQSGAPFIFVRDPLGDLPHQRERWTMVDRDVYARMLRCGIREGLHRTTLLAGIFS
jgi:hypothetical protein